MSANCSADEPIGFYLIEMPKLVRSSDFLWETSSHEHRCHKWTDPAALHDAVKNDLARWSHSMPSSLSFSTGRASTALFPRTTIGL